MAASARAAQQRVGTGEHPVGLLENGEDVPAFHLLESCRAVEIATLRDARLEVAQRTLEHRSLRQYDRPFDQVLHLANIPRPGISDENIHGLGGDAFDLLPHVAREVLRKVAYQEWDIFRVLAQRGNMDGKYIQPVEKIGAERLIVDHRAEVAMGGRNETRIAVQGSRAAQAFELALLQNPQQFRLQIERKITDFVEKNPTRACGRWSTS